VDAAHWHSLKTDVGPIMAQKIDAIPDDIGIYLRRLDERYSGETLDAKQVAEVLNTTPRAVENLRARGNLPFRFQNLGKRVVVTKVDVAYWLAGRRNPPPLENPEVAARSVQGQGKGLRKPTRAGIGAMLMRVGEQNQMAADFMTELASYIPD
jgi:hypothetical protein